MNWYIVIKTIKGRRYKYRQRTRREGASVRTESHYLGPAATGAWTVVTQSAQQDAHLKIAPTFAGECDYVDSMFDHRAPCQQWVSPLSNRYNYGHARGDPLLFAVAQQLGLVGISEPWGGKQRSSFIIPWSAPQRRRFQIPDPTRFETEEEFAATMLHELAHATGARLGRKPARTRYGYAHEQVVSELAAAMVMRRLGIKQSDAAHRHFIQYWWSKTWSQEKTWATAREEAKRAADLIFREYQHAQRKGRLTRRMEPNV